MEKQEAEIIQLNPGQDGNNNFTTPTLTIDKLKSYDGLHDLSDEQAQEALFAIHALAGVLYEQYLQQNLDAGGEGSIHELYPTIKHQQAA